MRTIVLCISDTHAGFKFGLMNPDVELHDRDEEGNLYPYKPSLNAVQRYFWKLYLQGCEAVKLYAKGDPIVVIHFGDITHGNKYLKTLVSTELADQPAIAVANMIPILELPNVRTFRLTIGTGAHNFDDGNSEKLVIETLKLAYPKINCEIVEHGLGSVDGFEIEYSHQGPFIGSRQHLIGNVGHQFLRDRMNSEIMSGHTPPGLYGYGHYHEWMKVTETISVGDIDYTSTLMVVPSFNFPNLWTTANTKAKARHTHGIVALEIINGQMTDYKRFTHTIDRRTKENL